jgi:hypothetical protein
MLFLFHLAQATAMRAKPYSVFLLLWVCHLCGGLRAQSFDLAVERLYEVPNAHVRSLPPADKVSATVRLSSDGAYLFLYVHVRDRRVQRHPRVDLSDHIELWLGLPAEAYPADFEYSLHPRYVQAPPMTTRGESTGKPRLFSSYAEYAPKLTLSDFVQNHDYPQQDEGRVPPAKSLRLQEVPYGLMKFALFADERPAVWLNQAEMGAVESVLEQKMGQVLEGITYQVNRQDSDGYEIHARIAPAALGFVVLPELERINVLVQVHDAAQPGQSVRPVLSTMPPPSQRHASVEHPSSFNRLRLQRPLYTNFTTIPDYMLQKVEYHPICVYTDQGWVATGIDVDPLIYREQVASQSLTEVGIMPQRFSYDVKYQEETPIEVLTVEETYVNQLPRQRNHILMQGQTLSTERIRDLVAEPTEVQNQFFRFPDGEMGAILRSNASVDPYGWGPCGTCIQETIRIWRVTRNRKQLLLDIIQGDGPNAYCQIQNLLLREYYLLRIDWVKPGEILVLRLNHRYLTRKKRIKVSWEGDGSGIKVEPID